MWLTPAADRPWISGTSDNSIWSLIVGYNGLGRVGGQAGGPAGGGRSGRCRWLVSGGAGFGAQHHRWSVSRPRCAAVRAELVALAGAAAPAAWAARAGGGGGNTTFGGNTGVFRLLNDALGSQAGWLLGGAVGRDHRAARDDALAPQGSRTRAF